MKVQRKLSALLQKVGEIMQGLCLMFAKGVRYSDIPSGVRLDSYAKVSECVYFIRS